MQISLLFWIVYLDISNRQIFFKLGNDREVLSIFSLSQNVLLLRECPLMKGTL